MTQSLSELQHLLLDLLSPIREIDDERIAHLSFAEWQMISSMAKRHRIEPLLHWQLQRAKAHINIPPRMKSAWSQAHRHSIMHSMAVQRELRLVHRLLDQADIPHIALKGAYLAYHVYPEPGLRPLRDIDILVSRDRAIDAYQFLLSHGLSGSQRCQENVELALDFNHHLSPLYSPSRIVPVEIHTRLFHVNDCRGTDLDLVETEGFSERVISKCVGTDNLSFLGPTDLLLHIVEHSSYGHQFDNGPLAFSDIAYLLSMHEVDWGLFWSLAEATGSTRGAILTLRLSEYYCGPLDIGWPDMEELRISLPREILEMSTLMSLSGVDRSPDTSLRIGLRKQDYSFDKVLFLWRRIFKSRAYMSTRYRISTNSPLIYVYYITNLLRIIIHRLPSLLRSLLVEEVNDGVDDISELNAWLSDQYPTQRQKAG